MALTALNIGLQYCKAILNSEILLYFWFLSCFRRSWLPPFPFLPHLHTSFSCFLGLHVGLGLRNHPTLAALHYVADKLSPLDLFCSFQCVKLPKGKKIFIFSLRVPSVSSHCHCFHHSTILIGKSTLHSDSLFQPFAFWFLPVLHNITSSGVELRS